MSHSHGHGGPASLVTGDAVALDLRPAGFASRAVAFFIDFSVQFALLVGVSLAVTLLADGLDQALPRAIELTLVVLTMVGYPVAFETLSRGRSLGKLALGLRVVSADGAPVRFRQSLARALAGILELWATSGTIALISSLLNRQGRRIGDFLGGTVVVQERSGRRPAEAVEMPPSMAGWAQVAELSRLPADVAAAAYQYLTRYTTFDERTRYEMGLQLADTVSRYVAPPPPPQASPPEFLAAVLAERRRREEERLARLQAPHQD